MTGLDCPMQTKALHLFWHKAELRLVEQPAPEAPVFAMSRPSLLGGREEFLLQYPARLEPLTEREIARHRFTVRHGKKRRSFQAPDAATFETWLSALEQALESKPEPEHTPTPSSTSSNATTAVSSQGKTSSPRSTGTYESSRDGRITAGSNVSSQRSNISSHASTARAPPLRLTLERPCFTRDPRNLKLIWLHRPAWTTPSAANANADVAENELDVNISVESEFEELADGATDDIAFGEEAAQEVSDEDEDQDDHNVLSVVAHDEDVDEFLGDDTVDGFTSDDADTSSAGVVSELNDSERDSINVDESYLATSIIATSPVNTSKFEELTGMAPQKDMAIVVVSKSQLVRTGASSEVEDTNSEVVAMVEALVSAVVDQCNVDEAGLIGSAVSIDDDVKTEIEAAAEAAIPAVTRDSCDTDKKVARVSERITTTKSGAEDFKLDVRAAPESQMIALSRAPEDRSENAPAVELVASSAAPLSFKKRTTVKSSKRSSSKHKWVPLDPTNSSLIWVRGSAEADVKSAPRSSQRRTGSKKWTPVDPSNTRLVWIQRVEAAARVGSRYQATPSTRKWVPLEPDNSKYIWTRRQASSVHSSCK